MMEDESKTAIYLLKHKNKKASRAEQKNEGRNGMDAQTLRKKVGLCVKNKSFVKFYQHRLFNSSQSASGKKIMGGDTHKIYCRS